MLLRSIDDPRSDLDKARRRELYDFARENGVELEEGMPAILMRKILRERGLTRIKIPPRPLGQQNQPGTGLKYKNQMQDGKAHQPQGIESDAIADLVRQYSEQRRAPAVEEKRPADMSIHELRAAVKAKGLKLARTDTMQDLRAKLGG